MQQGNYKQELYEQIMIWAENRGINQKEAEHYCLFLLQCTDREFIMGIVQALKWSGIHTTKEQSIKEITEKEEADVLTAYCFRNNGLLTEFLYDGEALLTLERVDDWVDTASDCMAEWIKMRDYMKDHCPTVYNMICNAYQAVYTKNWEK
ncbi:MAG: hypothetical protein ACI4XL_12630 [Bacillus sp. (in: firmicutes)]